MRSDVRHTALRHNHFVWGAIAACGAAFMFWAAFPGFMSPDSIEQYRQAHSLKFGDSHPPVMAWLWSKLLTVWQGPESLLFVHLAVLWTGLYVWCRNADGSRYAKWFVVLGLAPWVVNFSGVLWKDVGMAVSLVLASALLSKKRLDGWSLSVALCLLLYAFMVRGNAAAALIPLVWYASRRVFPQISFRTSIVVTMVAIAGMFVFLNLFNYRFLQAENDHMTTYMMTDDLVHLSLSANASLLPGVDFSTVKECSEEVVGETRLVGRLFCLFGKPAYQSVAPIPYEDIHKEWIAAVRQHPFEYVGFRLKAYLYLLRSPGEGPYIPSYSGMTPNEMGVVQKDNPATLVLRSYQRHAAHLTPFLFKPYWWLAAALAMLFATRFAKGNNDAVRLIRVLLASGILYMLSYIPSTPMADFRYVYWSTIAISLAALTWRVSSLHFRGNASSNMSTGDQ